MKRNNNSIDFISVENMDRRFADPKKMDLAIEGIIQRFNFNGPKLMFFYEGLMLLCRCKICHESVIRVFKNILY